MNRILVTIFLVDLYFSYLFIHEIGKLSVMCGIPLNVNKIILFYLYLFKFYLYLFKQNL